MNKKSEHFSSPIYTDYLPELLQPLIKFTDTVIEVEKKIQKNTYTNLKSNRSFKEHEVTDHGWVYHSGSLLNYEEISTLSQKILLNSFDILDEQGYELKDYKLYFNEFWVQEFSNLGGGNHNTHIHGNSHISGFYFLKCSEKTSYPVFHDPRQSKLMCQLPEKDENNLTLANEKISVFPKPGILLMFNSYLPHEFVVDNGIEPFRFIHFNIQAIKNHEQLY
jgi:hypothetical protein